MGTRQGMQGGVKTSQTFSEGGALTPFFARGDLGSSHTYVWCLRCQEKPKGKPIAASTQPKNRTLVYYKIQIEQQSNPPMEEYTLPCFKKKKKRIMKLENVHYTSTLNKGQNCLKWLLKI